MYQVLVGHWREILFDCSVNFGILGRWQILNVLESWVQLGGEIGFDCSVISGTLEGEGRFSMFREIWDNEGRLDLIVL